MSVLIKGMRMPPCCGLCIFEDYGYCTIAERHFGGNAKHEVASFCPLIKLPEHYGRLIDAEFLKEHLYACATNGRPLHRMYQELDELLEAINDIPTIIEAEGGEE